VFLHYWLPAELARLWLSLFLSALDGTIVTTGLIKISSDFDALSQAAWLITTYLLTYNCGLSRN
jgi:MFS family permease